MFKSIATWIRDIDESTNGLRPGTITTVTGYTGHCKTLFALSQAYRSFFGGWDTFVYFKGTPEVEVKNRILTLHANNLSVMNKFNFDGDITYKKIHDDILSEKEKVYLDQIKKDFTSFDEGYGPIYYGNTETNLYDKEISNILEKSGVNLIVLDGFNEEDINSIINYTYSNCILDKNPSLRFLITHHTSYEAYRRAVHNDGYYDTDTLKNSTEIFRASKLIMSLYYDPSSCFDKRHGEIKISCLKYNYGIPFKGFCCSADFKTGSIFSFRNSFQIDEKDDLDEILDKM